MSGLRLPRIVPLAGLALAAVAVLTAPLLAPAVAEAAAWSVVTSPNAGTVNELHAVASVSANDVWAVGEASQQTLTEHWNGHMWRVVPSPNVAGSDGLFGVAAVSAKDVWAVGRVNTAAPPLIEHWNGTRWRVVKAPAQAGFLDASAAVSANDVWAVGEFLNASHVFQTLVERWNGHKWSVVPSPNGGTQNNQLSGVAAVSAGNVWAVGEFITGSNVQSLIEHWNGS